MSPEFKQSWSKVRWVLLILAAVLLMTALVPLAALGLQALRRSVSQTSLRPGVLSNALVGAAMVVSFLELTIHPAQHRFRTVPTPPEYKVVVERTPPGVLAEYPLGYSDIYKLWQKAYDRPLLNGVPADTPADYAAAIRAHWIDVLEDDTGLIALIEMIPLPDHLLIENVAVRADRQGRGLGSLLVDHAEAIARDNGLMELRLYTNVAFASNLIFYTARSFVETGRSRPSPVASSAAPPPRSSSTGCSRSPGSSRARRRARSRTTTSSPGSRPSWPWPRPCPSCRSASAPVHGWRS
jgi:GNAT superfamily N-acetyltransferase